MDDFSRECVGQLVDSSISGTRLARYLQEISGHRSLPRTVVCDNGPELTSKAMFFWSQQSGVKLHFIQPGKPTDNAHIESFNGTFRDECLNANWFATIADARHKIQEWRQDYNDDRPHSALGYRVVNGSFGSGGFRTSFLLFNLSSGPASVSVTLTRDDGTPLVVNIPGTGTGSKIDVSLRPGGSAFLQTDGQGALAAGAARITSTAPIGASAIFSVFDARGMFQTEAGVGDSPVMTALTLPVQEDALRTTLQGWLENTAAST